MTLDAYIAAARKKYFIQRIIKKTAIAAGACILICGIIIAFMRAGIAVPAWVWVFAALPWAALVAWAYPWRTSNIELARQIDKANNFGERLSSAMAFMNHKDQTEWMKIQIKDTLKRIESEETQTAFLKKAYPLEKPDHLRSLAISAVIAILIALIPNVVSGVASQIEKRKPDAPEIAQTPEVQPLILDTVTQELRQNQIDELIKQAEEIDDPELKETAEEFAKLLEDVKAQRISNEEFERRLAELERKLDEADTTKEQKAFDQKVKEAIEAMTQMKEDPETQELAEALEKNDYDKAAEILKDLLDSTDPNDKKKLEKLAKMFGDLAKNLDPTDPELKEALEKNKDLVDRLKKEFDNGKLSEDDKKAFKEAAQKLKEAEKEQQKANDDKVSKSLNKLSKAMNKTAEDLEKQAQDNPEQDADNPENKQEKEIPKEDATEKGQQPQQAQPQQGENQEGEQKQGDQQQGKQKQGDQQQGDQQEGEQQQGEQQEGEQQQGEQNAQDALQDAAQQQKAQQQRDAMKDLADKMRKDAQQQQNQTDEEAKEREQNMQDFMDRAKGQEKQKEEQPQNGEEQQQAQQEGPQDSGQQQAQQGDQNQQGQQGQQGEQESGQPQGELQQGQELGQENGIGDTTLDPEATKGGHDPSEGEATSMDVNLRDEKLSGMDTGQQSTSEIIETAGQKGFASESYKEVYQTYEKAAESILESEEVPQGYRNYVEKYFDMIRPQ